VEAHRFQNLIEETSPRRITSPALVPGAFLLCPVPVVASPVERSFLQQVYQWAFEQAQAVVRPSWLERDPLGHWN